MKMAIPYQIPFLAKEVGAELAEGVFAATNLWWTLEDKYPLAIMFVACGFRRSRPEIPSEDGHPFQLKPARDSYDPAATILLRCPDRPDLVCQAVPGLSRKT